MKAFIAAAALLAATHSNAEVFAEMKNQVGGTVSLESTKCKKGGHIAYSTMPGRSTLFGCWVHDDNGVHIFWDDGDARFYPYTYWTLKNAPKKVEPTL
jgi:hypothetical protein